MAGKKHGKKKLIQKKLPAKDAYTRSYFQKNRFYAEKIGEAWVVLSAKYGFLFPDDKIEDYNVTFKSKKTRPISYHELQKQVKDKKLDRFEKIIVLGGKEYLDAVKEAFINTDCIIDSPFEGLPIEIRMSKLNEAINR